MTGYTDALAVVDLIFDQLKDIWDIIRVNWIFLFLAIIPLISMIIGLIKSASGKGGN